MFFSASQSVRVVTRHFNTHSWLSGTPTPPHPHPAVALWFPGTILLLSKLIQVCMWHVYFHFSTLDPRQTLLISQGTHHSFIILSYWPKTQSQEPPLLDTVFVSCVCGGFQPYSIISPYFGNCLLIFCFGERPLPLPQYLFVPAPSWPT